ncbi:glycosyltransferase family 4 protein [Cytobacillus oceanisediminis]|uniref:glycosyltransferase family 4 protein n=1 Tax=Cytobacillus oceanisediminis TaxID=665099 RepID=UPI00204097AF|nr:glycosyltransferase family 4 protein [Cytobacillus oceanisediminis]MCM3403675.1 glycosyltransferase family 4 protein [Cytobacillus oceanisediminis]MDK7666819.1 glycosyltransferase family 4 protein [Cytobacillus oceanisediminis]
MRVIYLCQHFPPETGAPQIRVYEVSKELISRGHQVEVITAFPHHPHGIIPEEYKGRFYMFENWDGIPVHRSWIYPSPKGSFWKRLASYFSFTFSAFYSILKSKPTDVIICNSPPLFLGITGYLGAKMKRAKFVFNVADIWPESAVELGILKNRSFIRMAERLEMFLYRKSWKIATATEGIKEYMVRKGKKEEDVFLLPNGVNTDTFAPQSKNTELLREVGIEGKKVFMYAGNLGYAQGLDSVLRAAALLKDKQPDAHFLFVGDGQEREKLLNLKEELQLDNVTFYGSVPVSAMPDMFAAADYSIVSLRNIELFKGARPSKIFPAISSGVPVLYCGDGESAAILEEYNCGKIAPPENPEGIAAAVSDLMSVSDKDYQTMRENGRKLAIDQYSWKSIVDDILFHLGEQNKENRANS